MGNPFATATTVRAGEGAGHYVGEIDGAWNLRPLPQGGVVTSLAVRAMATELDEPAESLRTLHTTFAAQVADGPVDIDVDVIRRGRTMSQLRAHVRNPGAPTGHLTTAVFGRTRDGFSFTDLEPPEGCPPPDACRSFRDPLPEGVESDLGPPRFWDELVEGRPATGHAWWEDFEPGRAERCAWYRFDDPPFLDDGTVDPLSLVVLADVMPGAVSERIGPQERDWFAPSVDLTFHLLGPCRSAWVLAHNRARFAGDGYVSADAALWDCGDDGQRTPELVAYATQVFLLSFPAEPPAPEPPRR